MLNTKKIIRWKRIKLDDYLKTKMKNFEDLSIFLVADYWARKKSTGFKIEGKIFLLDSQLIWIQPIFTFATIFKLLLWFPLTVVAPSPFFEQLSLFWLTLLFVTIGHFTLPITSLFINIECESTWACNLF